MDYSMLPLTTFDVAGASDREYEDLATFEGVLRAERMPGEPPVPLDDVIAPWRHIPPFVKVRVWAVWNAEQTAILGMCQAE